MTGTSWPPAGSGMERTRARRWSPWQEVGGLLALAVAVGLWVLVVAGVAAPLGATLARLEAPGAPEGPALAACATPPDALAAVSRASPDRSCP